MRSPTPPRDVRGAAAVHDQTLAVYRLLDALHERFPSLEIESCAGGGGGRIDLGIMERIQETVDGQGLVVDAAAPGPPRGGGGDLMPRGQQRGVVVPLEVGDAKALHEGGDGIEQVVPGAGSGQVQDPLVAVLGRSTGAVGQDPLRVGAGQLGVER